MSPRAERDPVLPGARAERVAMAETDLEQFYLQTFLPLVRRATWKHGLSKEDARDIVQDAFVLGIAKLDTTGNPRAWLIQVVDHLSINHQRKSARRAQLAARWAGADRSDSRADDYEGPDY
jgi:DNA-directed RNA polymerase specialized sigma24 family protein